MLKHETKLIDPDMDTIIATLSTSVVDANKRCRARLLKDDAAKWRKFTRDAAAKPEGYAMFRGGKGGVPATQILAAWWTDSIGRKHVVIRGRRLEHDEAKRMLHTDELDKRPALWHAYPEYVCRRTIGTQSQIVCACGCGAVGTPEALGWMGETCGPCFDRKEELGPGGLSGNLPGVLYSDREPLGAVACSPDGTRVAAVEGNNSVTYWDIPRRMRTTMKFSGRSITDVAFNADAHYLLITGFGLVPGIGLFAAYDLTTDPPMRVQPTLEADPQGWRIIALPDPALALAHHFNPPDTATRAAIIRIPGGEVVRSTSIPSGLMGRLAVSPNGKQFAAVGYTIMLFDVATMRMWRELPGSHGHAAFAHDNTRLFSANGGSVKAYDVNTRKLAAEHRGGTPAGYITSLAVDPGGEFVYTGTFTGRLQVFAANTLAPRAEFDWHFAAIRGLAVSADGSRLFSSSGDGCVKVWPIRDLLRGA